MTELRPPVPNPSEPAAAPATTIVVVTAAPAAGDTAAQAPRPTKQPLSPRHYLWIAGAALVVFFGLRYLGAVLTPFLVGAILAYLGTPLVDMAERRGI
ncbi:MAG: hypothetical protein ABIO63_08555, partial [Casimicrobiaceae bacterium]